MKLSNFKERGIAPLDGKLLYQQEMDRASKQIARMVPHLKEAYCLRDARTKLNVAPSKIM